MRSPTLVTLAAAAFVAACAQTARVQSSAGEVAASVPANRDVLPAGSTMEARLNQTLGTASNHQGDRFTATVTQRVLAQDGSTVVPAGAILYGHVSGIQPSTPPVQPAVIKLDFDSLAARGRVYPFDATIEATHLETTRQRPSTAQTEQRAAQGAVAGAVLGAVLGKGGLSKIVLGGVLGAAAGTAISLGTGETEAALPSGTTMTLRATQSVAFSR